MGRIRLLYNKYITEKKYLRFRVRKINNKSLKLIDDNKKYFNSHLNQRCFILGNGPSLKQENLSLLCDEFVFTVNQAIRNPQFSSLKSNYHFWADPVFFKVNKNNPEDIELLNTMLSVSDENPNIQCFFPVEQVNFIRENEIDRKLNVNYYYTDLYMYDGYSKDIDYTKPVIGFGTVVQWCITMAVYMGFSEIYLLGCDNTGIITTIKSILHKNDNDDYVYNVSENEKKRMEKMLERSSLEAYLRTYLCSMQDYRRLYEYCSLRNIKLINCSAETVIDSIPRKSLTEVLNGI